MGQVWAGNHRASRTPVAVKVLTGEMARAPRYLESFRNEVRAAAGLDHPSIVVLYDDGEIPAETERRSDGVLVSGSPYLVMERLPGATLSELRGRLEWPVLRTALLDLLSALAHAHARGVIHRDIKPSNVLIQDSGGHLAVKLGDFGLAHPFERERLDREDLQVVGTPAFMAPEQLLSRWHDYGPWTDLFAFGCLGYTLVAGHPPWANVTDSIAPQLYRPAPRLEPVLPVPPGFDAWLARLLAREPAHRFVRAADAAWALRALPELPSTAWSKRVRLMGDAEGTSDSEPTAATRPATAMRPEPPEGFESASLPAPGEVVPPPLPAMLPTERPEGGSRLAGAGLGLFGLRRVPLVGRGAEREALWAALRAVVEERKPRMVLLRGPAGCGKSRLAEWLTERALELGAATVIRGTHSPEGGPADGVPAMVSRLLRCRDMPRVQIVDRARAALASVGALDPLEALALAELVCPAVTPGVAVATVRLGGPTERHELVRRLLERVAAERPILAWLDDVQWGADSLDLVAHILGRAANTPSGGVMHPPLPLLFVLTARTEDGTTAVREGRLLQELATRPETTVLEIGPLPAEERPALVRELLGLEGSLAEEVEARMQGNPLFAVQLVGEWVHAGLLEPGPSGFRLREGARPEVPRDALALWSSRIERLLEGRRVEDVVALELAALLGTEVDASEWREVCRRAMLPAPTDLVGELLRRGLARAGVEGPDAGWSFAHDLLRDSVERRARAAGRSSRHHLACAEMLRRRPGPGVSERLGRHLVAAIEPAQAVQPLLDAARERFVRGDLPTAWRLVGDAEAAMEDARLPSDDERRGEAMVLREEVAERRGDLGEATRWGEAAVRVGVQLGRPGLRARGLGGLGRIARQRGQLARAWLQLRRAERIARLADDRKVLGDCRRYMGRLLGDRGELERAGECYRLGLADYEAVHDDEGAAFCSWGLATLARKAGGLDEAVLRLGDARDRFERCGSRWGVALCVNLLGEVARFREQRTEAELHYREALSGFRAVGSLGDASVVEFNLCLLLVQTGRREEARKTLEAGLTQALLAERQALAVSVLAALLPCDAGAGDWDAWDTHLGELEELRERIGIVDVDIAGAAQLGAELAAEAGETERARGAWEVALAQWTGLGRTREANAVRARLLGR
jgi:tetratricopeptide (TPR) repeat protein